MKLKDIISVLKENLKNLDFTSEQVSHNGSNYSKVGNLDLLRDAIRNIQSTGIASEIIDKLIINEIFNVTKNNLMLTTNEAGILRSDIVKLRDVVNRRNQIKLKKK